MPKNTRTSQAFINGIWQDIKPIEIKRGMIFNLFEPDGTPVAYEEDYRIIDSWIATSDAYYNNDGIICVDTEY